MSPERVPEENTGLLPLEKENWGCFEQLGCNGARSSFWGDRHSWNQRRHASLSPFYFWSIRLPPLAEVKTMLLPWVGRRHPFKGRSKQQQCRTQDDRCFGHTSAASVRTSCSRAQSALDRSSFLGLFTFTLGSFWIKSKLSLAPWESLSSWILSPEVAGVFTTLYFVFGCSGYMPPKIWYGLAPLMDICLLHFRQGAF